MLKDYGSSRPVINGHQRVNSTTHAILFLFLVDSFACVNEVRVKLVRVRMAILCVSLTAAYIDASSNWLQYLARTTAFKPSKTNVKSVLGVTWLKWEIRQII